MSDEEDRKNFEKMQPEILLAMGDLAITQRGATGALRWAAHVFIEEARAFSSKIKTEHGTGKITIELTEDMIRAQNENEMVWAMALLVGIVAKTNDKGEVVKLEGEPVMN